MTLMLLYLIQRYVKYFERILTHFSGDTPPGRRCVIDTCHGEYKYDHQEFTDIKILQVHAERFPASQVPLLG